MNSWWEVFLIHTILLPKFHFLLSLSNVSHSAVSDSLQTQELRVRLLYPLNSPGKNTGMGCHSLLQGTFWTQGLNPCLLRLRWQVRSLPPGNPELFKALLNQLPRAPVTSATDCIPSFFRTLCAEIWAAVWAGVGGSVPASPRSLLIPGLWQHGSRLPTASPGCPLSPDSPFIRTPVRGWRPPASIGTPLIPRHLLYFEIRSLRRFRAERWAVKDGWRGRNTFNRRH